MNGRAIPIANRNAPIGGATSWLVRSTDPVIRAFAIPRSSLGTRRGRMLALPMSANVSAVPSANRAASTTTMLTTPVATLVASSARMTPRIRLTTAMSRTRSTRSATTPAANPNSSTGRFWASTAIDTRSGSRVWLATSSGPAASAMPSPVFVTTDVRSSTRKERPSRGGAIASAARPRGFGTAGVYGAPASRRGDGALVERHDPAGEALPADVDEPGLAHDLPDPLRRRVRLYRPDEISVRRPLTCQPADDGDDPVEPPAHEPGEPASRSRDLEAQDPAA